MPKTILVTLTLATLVATGCRVKETKDTQGKTKYEVEPAKVEVGTDKKTVDVPTVQLAPDSSKKDTTATTTR